MLIHVAQLSLELKPAIQFTPAQLRGAISTTWPEQELLHQHFNEEDKGFSQNVKGSSIIYGYPRVRYIAKENITPLILGIEEGIPILEELVKRLEQAQIYLGRSKTEIIKITFIKENTNFGLLDNSVDNLQTYSFLTPWLALNEENHRKYINLASWREKKALLEKILVGNIISMSKSLGYTVPEPIKANILKMKEVRTFLKGTPMLGFLGEFSVNFEIPDYWGIGKSVSRGFGTVKRVRELKSE